MVDKRGTVLMETVLVLPILTMLIFAIVQFSLVWYARIMTQYAAYNAARATLVYHPGEYRVTDKNATAEFKQRQGPCWEAACRTLAWVSSSFQRQSVSGGGGCAFIVPGWWPAGSGYAPIPNSSHIQNQVRIVQSEESVEMTNAPVVRVTVEFDYPLHVPVIGRMLAYFDKVEKESPSKYEVWGWSPNAAGVAKLDTMRHRTMNVDFITLRATAILPKPYRTSHFARISSAQTNNPLSASVVLQQFQNVPSGLAGP